MSEYHFDQLNIIKQAIENCMITEIDKNKEIKTEVIDTLAQLHSILIENAEQNVAIMSSNKKLTELIIESERLRIENAEQAKRIDRLKNRVAEQDEEYNLLENELAAEREKNKRPDCEKCENQNRESYCRLCKWELKDEDNYK